MAKNTVKAGIHGGEILAETGTVTISAEADNAVNASAMGGAVGALAVGAMQAETKLGTAAEEEVVAEIGDLTVIRSAGLKLQSLSNDDIFAEAEALSGGLVGLAGADVNTVTRQDSIARVGDNVEIHTGTLDIGALKGVVEVDFSLSADPTPTVSNGQIVRVEGGQMYKYVGGGTRTVATNEDFDDQDQWEVKYGQSADARGDALAFGLGAGFGVDVDNLVLGQAVVDIGEDSELFASDIFIDAKNIFTKERFKDGFNLSSGSVGLVSFGVMSSTTEIGNASQSFDARVDIGNRTRLQVDAAEGEEVAVIGAASRDAPRIEIETEVEAKAVDNVKVEAVSGLVGGAKGKSVINAELESKVNINGATIVNNDGDVFFTARTDTLLRPNASLTVASGLTGAALADVETITDSLNEVRLVNAKVRGADISLFAGEDSIRVPNVMFSFADAQVFTASLLPSIGIPLVVAELNENNIVNVLGSTVIEATSDINLYATEGIGGGDRAATTGSMLSLSLVPYGVVVPDGAEVTSTNEVNIASTAYLEAGINNIAPVYLLPVNTTSSQPGIELPAGITYADLKTNEVLLTNAQKVAFGLVDADGIPLDAELEFEAINVEKIGFFVDNGTVIEHAGDFFVLDPDFFTSSGSVNLVLQDEDYTDTERWNEITISHDLSVNPTPTVSNGQIIRTADGVAMKFVGAGTYTLSLNEEENNFDDPAQWAFIGNIYRSDVTDSLQLDLDGKIYVIKPVDLPDPILTYTNIGSLLVRQLEEVESWIASHAGDPEAIARYNVQRDDILATMADLGLFDADGQPVRELDTVLIDLPDIVSSAGSVFINVDGMLQADSQALEALVDAGRIVPNAGARIDILNRTPDQHVGAGRHHRGQPPHRGHRRQPGGLHAGQRVPQRH